MSPLLFVLSEGQVMCYLCGWQRSVQRASVCTSACLLLPLWFWWCLGHQGVE